MGHGLCRCFAQIIIWSMKLQSKYFDSIRVASKRRKGKGRDHGGDHPPCQWRGCDKKGSHRAPKGRGREGEYFNFCVDHVRQYNANYNYFDGMSDSEVIDFQKDAMTGHRPTWKVGANAGPEGSEKAGAGGGAGLNTNDPHGFFASRAKKQRAESRERRRKLKPLERKSLDVMHLGERANKDEIKARFKELVKQHHPDANGGDTRSEDKLREIIQAYNYLKQAGLA